MTNFLPENDQELRDGLSELAESVVAHIIDQDPEHHWGHYLCVPDRDNNS